jgi:uncharacterized protein (TIGR02145 family)
MNKVPLLGCFLLIMYSACTRNTVTVTDIDGNVYHTVKIGSQVWTVENLQTTKFNDGTPIPNILDSNVWHSNVSPALCYYKNTTNADSIRKFGALYNWYCVDSKKLAPPGWRVPTNDDWETLQNYLIEHGHNWDRTKSGNRIAKSLAAQSDWRPFIVEGMPGNNMKDNNKSGFTGLPAGYRYDTQDSIPGSRFPWKESFSAKSHKSGWWSANAVDATCATVYGLGFCVDNLLLYEMFSKTCGYSVRLVQNEKQ